MTNIFNSAGTLEVIFKVSPAWFVAHRLRRRRSWWWELRMSLERGRGPHRLSQGPEPHTLQAQRWRMTSLVREPHMWWPVQHTSAPEFGTPWVQGMLCCFPPTHKAKLGCRRPNQKPNQPVCWTQRNEVFVTSNLGLTKTNFSKKGSKMPKPDKFVVNISPTTNLTPLQTPNRVYSLCIWPSNFRLNLAENVQTRYLPVSGPSHKALGG
eukprot:EG_transcript_12499